MRNTHEFDDSSLRLLPVDAVFQMCKLFREQQNWQELRRAVSHLAFARTHQLTDIQKQTLTALSELLARQLRPTDR